MAKVTVDRINFKPEAEKERNDEIKRILAEFDSLLIYPLFESSFPDPIPSDEQKIGIKINLIF